MSLILDALTRAEQEKRQPDGAPPDLLSPALTPARERRRFGLWLTATIVIVGVGGLLAYLTQRDRGDDAAYVPAPTVAGRDAPPARVAPPAMAGAPTSTVQRGETAGASPGATPARPRAGEASTTATPSPRGDADVRALYERIPPAQPTVATPQSAPSPGRRFSAEPESTSGPSAAAAQTRATAPPASPPEERRGSETPVDVEAVLRQVQREARNAALEAHSVPFLADLSKQFRDSVPTLMYQGHDYRGDGASTVRINGATLRVGQRSRGVELREILSDSVILRFDGMEFRLRALNSWVNL